jgi:hypothetical protein
MLDRACEEGCHTGGVKKSNVQNAGLITIKKERTVVGRILCCEWDPSWESTQTFPAPLVLLDHVVGWMRDLWQIVGVVTDEVCWMFSRTNKRNVIEFELWPSGHYHHLQFPQDAQQRVFSVPAMICSYIPYRTQRKTTAAGKLLFCHFFYVCCAAVDKGQTQHFQFTRPREQRKTIQTKDPKHSLLTFLSSPSFPVHTVVFSIHKNNGFFSGMEQMNCCINCEPL